MVKRPAQRQPGPQPAPAVPRARRALMAPRMPKARRLPKASLASRSHPVPKARPAPQARPELEARPALEAWPTPDARQLRQTPPPESRQPASSSARPLPKSLAHSQSSRTAGMATPAVHRCGPREACASACCQNGCGGDGHDVMMLVLSLLWR